MSETANTPLRFAYTFDLGREVRKNFTLDLDRKTLALITKTKEALPEWTRLDCQQCCNCPLTPSTHTSCPIAANITELIDFSRQFSGNDPVEITIATELRTFNKKTDLRSALGAIFGIYMVSSGCPVMDKLRPLVRFHLPFASAEESMARAMSMYLLAQYFLKRKGRPADWHMNDLQALYENINIINFSLTQRLRVACASEANFEALTGLDFFGQCVALSISGKANQGMLKKLENLYQTSPAPKRSP
ncbi:MAG: hypothetical protein HQL20_01390 [Candidatus Omnitrophica bacterium]|nr:hypothetical protein [Candidatus Omnitrophota bacterium]